MIFTICGLTVKSDYTPASFLPFLVEGKPELTIKMLLSPLPCPVTPVSAHPDFSVYQIENGWLYQTPQGEQLMIDSAYQEGQIYIPPDAPQKGQDIRLTLLLRVCIECRLIHRSCLSLHAACVVQEGRAVAFTGVSGTGKSTRAAQWVNTLDAHWLSGDRPSLGIAEGRVYGVPWDGKEQIFCPESAPLAAILDVRRSPFTRIRHITKAQARRILMQQCFLPMWDSETAALAIALINQSSESLPMYRLLCDQDDAAAQQTWEILSSRPECILPAAVDLKLREDILLLPHQGRTLAVLSANQGDGIKNALSLNETAAFLLNCLKNPLCQEDLLALLTGSYQVELPQAERDWETIKNTFFSYGILQEQA